MSRYERMKYNRSGKSGLKLPSVSLGIWHNFGTHDDFNNMRAMCLTAFDHGITHFDAANNYGPVPGSAEENFGKILATDLAAHRDELIISTKAGYTMWEGPYGDWGSRKYLLSSLDQSLKRLGIKYVDIFYSHRMDPETPLEETMGALATAVHSGRALYAGISNYDKRTTRRAAEILEDLKCPFIINQIRYSIFDRHIEKDGLKKWAGKNGLGLIAFSPLAQGLLTDKYLNGIPQDSRISKSGIFLKSEHLTEKRLTQIRALNEIAKRRGQTLAQMALSWVLKDEDITSVLIGASKPEQIAENAYVAEKATFTDEELAEIDAICAE
ncbi:MAG: L-glyceraldehyde 3-phosphate reductase [Elusimicrobiaceae bacterium]|nr:L-glyceraldehyde 3-phosphate reductase [Elusimicrobiaceae bacterium]